MEAGKGAFTVMPKDDWRRRRQEDYLTGVRLYHVPFTPLSGQWDHGHCEFCFEKFFLHPDHPECLHEGYCTAPANRPGVCWICPDCFRDFREEFGWMVDGEESL